MNSDDESMEKSMKRWRLIAKKSRAHQKKLKDAEQKQSKPKQTPKKKNYSKFLKK
jgi:hypothetical protein